ncbi:MAG: hypothetical protein VXW32_00935 [Myxococcota bacterium]|nr:hypothetical protein [Myxococcota bacterium]
MLLLLLACNTLDRPVGIIEADRSGHFLDRPFPSDELLDSEGRPDLSKFPAANNDLGQRFSEAWARQANESVYGFSPLAPIFLRFDGPLPLAASEGQLEGREDDPIRLFNAETGKHVPIDYRFISDAKGDPFLTDNVLALAPQPDHALDSGGVYIAEVSTRIAESPENWTPPAGSHEDAALATRFTVQDVHGELEALAASAYETLEANPELLVPSPLKRLTRLEYTSGETPSGEEATAAVAHFEDGTSRISYLEPVDGLEVAIDFTDDPMEVYEFEIHTLAFRDLRTQPFTSPGLAFLNDFDRVDGRIPFQAGALLAIDPEPELMRVVLQVPRSKTIASVMTWDHGTAGHAYNAVQRANDAEDFSVLRAAWAEKGLVILSRDQPLYGTRYELIDEGFDPTLGFYTLNNLPAFRDNQRQGAVDHLVLHAFVERELGKHIDLPETLMPGAFGHSLGSVTANLGLAMQNGFGAQQVLLSGAGGLFSVYVTDTGLLSNGSGSTANLAQTLYQLLGTEAPENPSGSSAVGALLGIPEDAWSHVDRLHPAMGLFQLIMDGADPLAVAAYQHASSHLLKGIDDWQVPNITTDWLSQALPDAASSECKRSYFYDGHYCTFREPEGIAAFDLLADSLD